VRLTTSHCETLLLWNLSRGGQGPIWAVAPLDGWIVCNCNKGDTECKKFKQAWERANNFILQKERMLFEELEESIIINTREFIGEVVAFMQHV
jgi:hypothetical protein